ncbi:MAG: SDR family NAD(P)-dependent oxidoreductase [Anaerovoracaceae bacterium]|jgi:short-subunit dehydrogenase
MEMETAIVTGASSGLGQEFIKEILRRFAPREIWAIARRRERLEQLQQLPEAKGCRIRPLPLDLTAADALDRFEERLRREQPRVGILVNAAGFARIGLSREISRRDNDAMIDLNCKAAVDMTLAVLPYMERGSRILNICSVAGFQPLTGINTYAASKSFLLSWTKALHLEQLGSGIHVTAVCPYWMRDTEFIETAQQHGSKRAIRRFPLAQRARRVARWAMIDSAMNFWVSSPGIIPVYMRVFCKFIPHCIVSPIWDLLRRI